jgi:hypothetical protein
MINLNFIPTRVLPLVAMGTSALSGIVIGMLYENQRIIKATKEFLDKRAEDDKLQAAKDLGEKYILMYIAKMMNDRAQSIETMSEEDKLSFETLSKIAWSGQTDEQKLDAYHKVVHNLEAGMSDDERASFQKLLDDLEPNPA